MFTIEWLDEHYDIHNENERCWFTCKRCGQVVSYVTKHAAVRHGDDVEVLPATHKDKALAEAY